MKILLTETALLLAVALACGAKAQVADAPAHIETVAVAYADLDLSQPTGTRALNHRLKTAARRTCDTANLPMDHYLVRHWCIQDAVADGWAQVAAHRAAGYAADPTVTLAALRTRP